MNNIPNVLKGWRKLAGLTQAKASLVFDVSVDRYRRLEYGLSEPTGDEYERIREVIRKADIS